MTVYNRTRGKAEAWAAGTAGRSAATPRERLRARALCLPVAATTTCARSCWADGAFAGMAPGSVFVDHTTASAEVARELAARRHRAARLH